MITMLYRKRQINTFFLISLNFFIFVMRIENKSCWTWPWAIFRKNLYLLICFQWEPNFLHHDNVLIVRLSHTKRKSQVVYFLSLYRNFIASRPKNCILSYQCLECGHGKWYNYVINNTRTRQIPKRIAEYFKLPQQNLYTYHCFKHSSSFLLDDGGDNDSTELSLRVEEHYSCWRLYWWFQYNKMDTVKKSFEGSTLIHPHL